MNELWFAVVPPQVFFMLLPKASTNLSIAEALFDLSVFQGLQVALEHSTSCAAAVRGAPGSVAAPWPRPVLRLRLCGLLVLLEGSQPISAGRKIYSNLVVVHQIQCSNWSIGTRVCIAPYLHLSICAS